MILVLYPSFNKISCMSSAVIQDFSSIANQGPDCTYFGHRGDLPYLDLSFLPGGYVVGHLHSTTPSPLSCRKDRVDLGVCLSSTLQPPLICWEEIIQPQAVLPFPLVLAKYRYTKKASLVMQFH